MSMYSNARLPLLRKSLLEAPVVKKGDYNYFVHPITDGVPRIDAELLEEIIGEICSVADTDCDKIVTAEAMGIPIGTALSLRLGVPLAIIRKRAYNLPGEISIKQVTGYSTSEMFINGVVRGDRVLLVDDVLSTGGTLLAIADALKRMGADFSDIVIVIEKKGKREYVENTIGVPVKALISVEIVDGKVQLFDA